MISSQYITRDLHSAIIAKNEYVFNAFLLFLFYLHRVFCCLALPPLDSRTNALRTRLPLQPPPAKKCKAAEVVDDDGKRKKHRQKQRRCRVWKGYRGPVYLAGQKSRHIFRRNYRRSANFTL